MHVHVHVSMSAYPLHTGLLVLVVMVRVERVLVGRWLQEVLERRHFSFHSINLHVRGRNVEDIADSLSLSLSHTHTHGLSVTDT